MIEEHTDNRDEEFHPLAVETRMGFLQRIAIPAGYVRSRIRATDFMSRLKREHKSQMRSPEGIRVST